MKCDLRKPVKPCRGVHPSGWPESGSNGFGINRYRGARQKGVVLQSRSGCAGFGSLEHRALMVESPGLFIAHY